MSERTVQLEDLLGQAVFAENGKPAGRIEEFRAERRRRGEIEITEILLGPGALLERLSIVNRLFRRHPQMFVARWDQIDISRPHRPRLTCPVEALKVEKPRQRS